MTNFTTPVAPFHNTNVNPLATRTQFDGLDGIWTVTEAVQVEGHDEKFDVRYMNEDRLLYIDCTISVQEIDGDEVLWAVDKFEGHGPRRPEEVGTRSRFGAAELEEGDRIVRTQDMTNMKGEVVEVRYSVVDTRTPAELIQTWNERNNPLRIEIEEASHHTFGDWDKNDGIGGSDVSIVAMRAIRHCGIFLAGLTQDQWFFIRGQVQC